MKDQSNRTHLIKAYLNDSEHERFRRIATATNSTNSDLVRRLLQTSVFVEFPPVEYWEIIKQLDRIGKTGVQYRMIDCLKEYAEQKQQIHHFQGEKTLCSRFHTDVSQCVEKQCGGRVIDTGPGEDFSQSCQQIHDLASVDSITT